MEFLAHLGSQRVSQQDLQNLTQGEASSTEALGDVRKQQNVEVATHILWT